MKLAAIALLLATATASPEIRYFRYERTLQNLPQHPSQACLVLDAGIFAHAAPQLADLRLYRGSTETPYVVHFAPPIQVAESAIQPLNLGVRGGQTVFDADLHEAGLQQADMNEAKYSDLELSVTAQNFIATVIVSGSREQTGKNETGRNETISNETKLGSYTIFDLTRQRLGRSTVLHLPESDFEYLHFQIAGPLPPDTITGLSVTRLPVSLPKYEMVAESSHITQKAHSSILEFTVPAHVPVDRLVFQPKAEPGPGSINFSREVRITVAPIAQPPATDAARPLPSSTSSGTLLRVHRVLDGHRLDEEHLAIDAAWIDSTTPSKWTITIDNGDDAPLPLQSVQLQMLQRTLCFEAAENAGYTLYYGDPALSAPRYDYATLFTSQTDASPIAAAPEQPNPALQPRPDDRPFTEKHPALLWAALIAVIALLGGIALKSARPAK
jgi:hypothetical protein